MYGSWFRCRFEVKNTSAISQLALVLFSGLDDYPVPKLVDMFYAKPVKLIELIERLPFTDFFGESMSQHSGVVFSPVFDFSR